MLDMKPLRYFIALAEVKNFHRAAERLHLSQPSLSRHIAALEKAVGTQLVERNTRQLMLTPAGESFYQDARKILESLQQAQQLARDTAAGKSGLLRVGFTMYSAHSVIPEYVRLIRHHFPNIALELEEAVTEDLPDKVLAGEVDLAVLVEGTARVGMLTLTVLTEPLCVAMSRTHPKARSRKLQIEDLRDDPFVMTSASAGSRLTAVIMDYCRAHGFEPMVSLQVRLQHTMLSLVNDASYVALVPSSVQQLKMDGIVFKPLADAPQVNLAVAWSSDNRNPCLNSFIKLLIQRHAAV